MRILAIDPAIRNTGYAVIEGDHRQQKALDYGVISIPQKEVQSRALAAVRSGELSLSRAGLSAPAAAELLRLSALGLKNDAGNAREYRKRTRRLVRIFLAGLAAIDD